MLGHNQAVYCWLDHSRRLLSKKARAEITRSAIIIYCGYHFVVSVIFTGVLNCLKYELAADWFDLYIMISWNIKKRQCKILFVLRTIVTVELVCKVNRKKNGMVNTYNTVNLYTSENKTWIFFVFQLSRFEKDR